jgi:hypothetical protein
MAPTKTALVEATTLAIARDEAKPAKLYIPPAQSVVARLSNCDDGPPFKHDRVDVSRSGRLKR